MIDTGSVAREIEHRRQEVLMLREALTVALMERDQLAQRVRYLECQLDRLQVPQRSSARRF